MPTLKYFNRRSSLQVKFKGLKPYVKKSCRNNGSTGVQEAMNIAYFKL